MGITGGILTDLLIGAGVGAAGTAVGDAVSGSPVTWGGELKGAALGAGGAALGAGLSGLGDASGATATAGAATDLSVPNASDLGLFPITDAGTAVPGAADALQTVTVTGTAGGGGGGALGAFAPAIASETLSGQAQGALPQDLAAPQDPSVAPVTPFGGGEQAAPATIPDLSVPNASDLGLSDISADPSGGGGGIMDWLKKPKNLATAGLLGIEAGNILNPPRLPGAARQALGAAGPAVAQAEQVIQTGGYGTPIWTQQKSAIDTTINQQIQQQTESILQSAANAGIGGAAPGQPPTGVVQQMIAQMTRDANVQRQQLYAQALQQNVSNAIAELTGANQTLMSIAQLQYNESQQAQQLAFNSANLAARLFAIP